MAVDKQEILEALKARVRDDLDLLTRAQKQSAEDATHEEARAEDDKDTRATELSYLARGQAERVEALQQAVGRLSNLVLRSFDDDTPIALTALVVLESMDGETNYFVAPDGGGVRLEVAGLTVKVVTPVSPLGRAMIGKTAGDEVEVRTPKGATELLVSSIC